MPRDHTTARGDYLKTRAAIAVQDAGDEIGLELSFTDCLTLATAALREAENSSAS